MKITKTQLIVGGVAVGAALIYFTGAREIARAAVGVVADAAVGVVHGVSDVVGLQTPNPTECQKAKAAGDTWEASFACPVDEFLKYTMGK